MTVVSAFPLPPEGWQDLAVDYCPPDIPDAAFTCLGFDYNEATNIPLTDVEYKTKVKECFDQAMASYKSLLLGIENGIDLVHLQAVQDNISDALLASNCLSRLQVIDQVIRQLKSQFN